MYPDYRDIPEDQSRKLEEAVKQLSSLMPVIKMLGEKSPEEMTPEEAELVLLLVQSLPLLMHARSVLFNNILHDATGIYLHIEKLAREGNEEAKKVYDTLRPSYLAALKEDVDKEDNKN